AATRNPAAPAPRPPPPAPDGTTPAPPPSPDPAKTGRAASSHRSSLRSPRETRPAPRATPGTLRGSPGSVPRPSLSPFRSGLPRVHALDLGAQGAQALVDPLVAAFDLPYVVDVTLPFGAQRRNEERHPGADVRALHHARVQARWPDHHRPVRVAEHDPRAHADHLVGEEHPRFEHLLVDEDRALALRGHHERDGGQVRRERRPRAIVDLRHVPAEIHTALLLLIRRDQQVLTLDLAPDPEPVERQQRRIQVLDRRVPDQDLAPGHRGEADERAHFDVVAPDPGLAAVQPGPCPGPPHRPPHSRASGPAPD